MSADTVSWLANWVLIGALLVGVGATYAIVVSGNLKEAALKREVAAAGAVAATAKANAATATERTAALETEAAQAKARAAALENEAAQARLEQERLKAIVAWRTLTPEALNTLTESLRKDPKGSVVLAYTANDPEALYVVIQLGKAFENATGWDLGLDARTYPDRLYWGIYLPGESDLVKHLRAAFTAANIPFSTDNIPDPPMRFGPPLTPDKALIFVGSKRPPI